MDARRIDEVNAMTGTPVKLLIFDPLFFFIPSKKLLIESCPVVNRTYFIHRGKIVAVATLA